MKVVRWFFYEVVVKCFLALVVGIHVHHKERLPRTGPAIVTANHNSHLDAFVLVTLLPSRLLPKIRPVAAADYFGKSALRRWISQKLIGAILLSRKPVKGEEILAECHQALQQGELLILFPEGSRGEPEQLKRFKAGVARLAEKHPEVPVIPVFLQGLGKVLPKGEALLVPFFCDAAVGEPLYGSEDRKRFLDQLESSTRELQQSLATVPWLD